MNKIRQTILAITAIFASLMPAFSQPEPLVVMTLEECLSYAYENSQDLLVAELEIGKSKALTGEYLSAGLPQVDINMSLNKNFIVRKAFVPANIFDPTAPENEVVELPFGTPYDGDVGLSLNQMIFDGSYFVGLNASKVVQERSAQELVRTRIDVASAVTKAYYGVMVNEEAFKLVQANYNRLDTLLRETSIMYENGFAEKIDVNRTTVEFNNVKTQLDNSIRVLDISRQMLKFQMGMPVETPFEIGEELADLKFNIEELLLMSTDQQKRIEYTLINTQQKLAELEMKNNKVQYLPKIDLFFGWGMNAGVKEAGDLFKWSDKTVWPDYQLAGVMVNIPIFDGLYKSKRIQQNRIRIQQVSYQREQLKNSIRMEVREKRNNLVNSLEQLDNQTENMSLAEEVYTHSKIKYQEGVGSNLEVIEADNAFKVAQTNYYNALYEALISKVDYEKALGVLLD
jgi:outer membrane protein TolC